jgi:hypothetical protein
VFALESAAAILEGSEPPEPPEPVAEQAPSAVWPMRSGGVDYVVIKGKRYVLEGQQVPDEAEIVEEPLDGEIIEDEGEGISGEISDDHDPADDIVVPAEPDRAEHVRQQAGIWVSGPQPVRKELGRGPRRIIG